MRSPDTYRLKLQQLTASLKAWSGFVADVARVEAGEAGNAWRLALTPAAPGACPIEIVLDGSEPRCDLRIGTELVEDWRLPSLDVVLPLVEAVTEGRVVTRRLSSAVTALPLGVSTHVRLADGSAIVLPPLADGQGLPNGAVESRETHYLPYRKPAARSRLDDKGAR